MNHHDKTLRVGTIPLALLFGMSAVAMAATPPTKAGGVAVQQTDAKRPGNSLTLGDPEPVAMSTTYVSVQSDVLGLGASSFRITENTDGVDGTFHVEVLDAAGGVVAQIRWEYTYGGSASPDSWDVTVTRGTDAGGILIDSSSGILRNTVSDDADLLELYHWVLMSEGILTPDWLVNGSPASNGETCNTIQGCNDLIAACIGGGGAFENDPGCEGPQGEPCAGECVQCW